MQLLELTKLHPLLTLPQNPVAWVRSASLQPLHWNMFQVLCFKLFVWDLWFWDLGLLTPKFFEENRTYPWVLQHHRRSKVSKNSFPHKAHTKLQVLDVYQEWKQLSFHIHCREKHVERDDRRITCYHCVGVLIFPIRKDFQKAKFQSYRFNWGEILQNFESWQEHSLPRWFGNEKSQINSSAQRICKAGDKREFSHTTLHDTYALTTSLTDLENLLVLVPVLVLELVLLLN